MFLALLTTKVLAITTFGKVTAKKVFGNIGTQFWKYWHTISEILAHNFGNKKSCGKKVLLMKSLWN